MKYIKTLENFNRSEDDPSASVYTKINDNLPDTGGIGGIFPKENSINNWDNVHLTEKEIKFLISIYNNLDSGGPWADMENWKYITFEHGKKMMNKVINGKYKGLNLEITIPIANEILKKMNSKAFENFNENFNKLRDSDPYYAKGEYVISVEKPFTLKIDGFKKFFTFRKILIENDIPFTTE